MLKELGALDAPPCESAQQVLDLATTLRAAAAGCPLTLKLVDIWRDHGGSKPIAPRAVMAELIAFPAACAGAKAANKVVKEVTGKSPYKHCRSAVKGLRNIVLGRVEDEVGERLSEEVQELFSQEDRAAFERRLGSLDNLLDSVANNPAADDPSVDAELMGLKTVLENASAAKNAQGRADALSDISNQMISLNLALSIAAPSYMSRDAAMPLALRALLGVHCTFVMICLRRRSRALLSLRTGGASCLGGKTTGGKAKSRCGTWRPADAWRR